MRPIKFRGRDVHTGELIYSDGGVYYSAVGVLTNDGREVEPDSVAQLVGYDANGREVYEGDTLISDDGDYEDTAKLISNVCISDRLKEANS